MARKRYRRRASGRAGLVVCALFLAVICLLLYSRVFVLKRIGLSGNGSISNEEILRTAGLTLGTSMFFIDEDKLFGAFEREGRIKLLEAVKDWPDGVTLTFAQRVPVAAIDYLGVFYVVDENSEVIGQVASLPEELPVVTGITSASCLTGQMVSTSTPGQVAALSQILKAISSQAVSGISELNMSDLDNLYLMTRGGMLVMLGDSSDAENKLAWMKSALSTIQSEGRTTGRLNVTSGKSAIYSES